MIYFGLYNITSGFSEFFYQNSCIAASCFEALLCVCDFCVYIKTISHPYGLINSKHDMLTAAICNVYVIQV